MKCDICDAPMRERRATAKAPYYYVLGGLPHVGLVGITVYECPGHSISPVIPRIGELHRVIAGTFVSKPGPLTGAELRFLRKNVGLSAQKFAALLVVDPAHLSRVENGKQRALGPSTDRLARLIVTGFARGGEEVRKLLLAEAADRIERRKQTKTVATFKHEKNRWKVAA